MDKKRYFGNETLGLAWDGIKVRQVAENITKALIEEYPFAVETILKYFFGW